jgi:FAD-dependent urate hydroxylase
MMQTVDIAIVGAGPYGLAAAAHLHAAGREALVFGEPLRFWERHTPAGMLLRSPYLGSNIGALRKLGLRDYERESGQSLPRPMPVDRFIDYGKWFQKHAVPDVDTRDVRVIEPADEGFRLTVDDDLFVARRVVVAAGVGLLAWKPPVFAGFDAELVSHTLDHHELDAFAGRRITIVGGGQSALESAALLRERDAQVDLVVRQPLVRWLTEGSWKHTTWPVNRILYSRPDVGPAWMSHVVAHPGAFGRMPRRAQDRLGPRAIRPAGAGWLRPRVVDVPLRTGVEVAEATSRDGGVHVRLTDGSEQTVDHVMLGTGYRVDLSRYDFLVPALVQSIAVVNGYPRLSRRFETSVPGLHILGAPAAWSFGPLMRFVAGSGYAAKLLTRGLER